jgi:hypothetical protein
LAPEVTPVRVSTVLGDLEFTAMQFPKDNELRFTAIETTPFGAVGIENYRLWSSTDFRTWERVPATNNAWRLVVDGNDLIVLDGAGAHRLAWNGTRWTEQPRLDLPGPIDQIVFGPQGAVAWRNTTVSSTIIFFSADGTDFAEAESGPDSGLFVAGPSVPEEDRDFGDCRLTAFADTSKIDTVLATDAGFVALTSGRHPDGLSCAPLLWFSAGGNAWELISPESPFGEMAVVDAVVERNGRFVATGALEDQGGQDVEEGPALWVSDDALTWHRESLPTRSAVVAGEMGWMRIGNAGYPGAEDPDMWFSPDGLTWDGPYNLPAGLVRHPYISTGLPAVGADAIFGVGVDDDVIFVPVVARLRR